MDVPVRARLVKESRKSRRAQLEAEKKGWEETETIGGVAQFTSSPHSSVFRASFADGWIEATFLPDQGADGTLIFLQLLQTIKQKATNLRALSLIPEHMYRGSTGDPFVTGN